MLLDCVYICMVQHQQEMFNIRLKHTAAAFPACMDTQHLNGRFSRNKPSATVQGEGGLLFTYAFHLPGSQVSRFERDSHPFQSFVTHSCLYFLRGKIIL